MSVCREELRTIDAYFRATNYLTVGQIYLEENPLLREPLRADHVKPRPVGDWQISPALNLVYAHLNRLVREDCANAIFLSGSGASEPAVLANMYLEGSYTERCPAVTQDTEGMLRLFRRFTSSVARASMRDDGGVGPVLSRAFGAAFDNPDLLAVAVVVGETAPLEGAWKGARLLDPATDGAVLPVFLLDGAESARRTPSGPAPDAAKVHFFLACSGYEAHLVEGDEPMRVHADLASTLDVCWKKISAIQGDARAHGTKRNPTWPAIVLRTPNGWTGPRVGDASDRLPISDVRSKPEQLEALEAWMKSYGPGDLFDERGRPAPDLTALAPDGDRRMGSSSHAGVVPLAVHEPTSSSVAGQRQGPALHPTVPTLGAMLRTSSR